MTMFRTYAHTYYCLQWVGNGKLFKTKEKDGGGRVLFGKATFQNKCKHKCHPKINLPTNFYHNRPMRQCFKIEED